MNPSECTNSDCQTAASQGRDVLTETLEKAVSLSKRTGIVFIATANADGIPHIAAAAGGLDRAGPDTICVSEWFCPGTVKNLRQNRHVSLIIWDKEADFGYQLIGRFEEFKSAGVLNGYAPTIEKQSPLPQIERQLLIRIETLFNFSAAPHSDVQSR